MQARGSPDATGHGRLQDGGSNENGSQRRPRLPPDVRPVGADQDPAATGSRGPAPPGQDTAEPDMNMTGRSSRNAPPVPTICNTPIFSRTALLAPATPSPANRTANDALHFFFRFSCLVLQHSKTVAVEFPGSSPECSLAPADR